MSPHPPDRIKEIFFAAADLAAPARMQYLDAECGNDADLRVAVERLLRFHDEKGGLLDASSPGGYLAGQDAYTLSPDDTVGRFRILRLVGKGGMGEVYEALDAEFNRQIALKVLSPPFLSSRSFTARFRREVQLAWKVTDPNVCRILDVGRFKSRHGDALYLTMEFLDGPTLAARLKEGPVEPADAFLLISQIASGLAALHLAKVIHRDLKPANMMLVSSEDGVRCVITDFGLAHSPDPDAVADGATQTGQLLGTPPYMSPEQLNGEKIGPLSDIYSLGVVMYEILCGERPFKALQFVESATEKRTYKPPPPCRLRRLDPRWDAIVMPCLDLEPGRRPRDVQQVIGALERLRQKPSVASHVARRMLGSTMTRRSLYISAAAGLATTVVALNHPPARRILCRRFPGSQLLCDLPPVRDIAVLPFGATGSDDRLKAISFALGAYTRQAFRRLSPDPGANCVHLRNDSVADGVRLVLEGDVEASRAGVTFHYRIREPKPASGAEKPLVLRSGSMASGWSDLNQMHERPVAALLSALDHTVRAADFAAWSRQGPRFAPSFAAYLHGQGLLASGLYEEAIDLFNSGIEPGDFSFAFAHVGLGDAYQLLHLQKRDPTFAVSATQAYQRASQLDREFGFAGADRRWAALHASGGRHKEAIQLLKAALNRWPDDQDVRKALAQELEGDNDIRSAESLLREGVSRAPRCWLSYNTLADHLSRRSLFEEAEKELMEAIRLIPANAAAYFNIGFDYYKRGRIEDAIEMTAKGLALRPSALAFSTLGRAYLHRGCRDDGLTNLEAAIAMDPGYFVLWANLAEGLCAIPMRNERAREACQRVIDLSSKLLQKDASNAFARAQLAVNLARLGQRDAALQAMDVAVREAGGSHDIALLAIETLDTLSMREEALSRIEQAIVKTRLTVNEIRSALGLAGLRDDPAYKALLARLRQDPAPAPGGLVSRAINRKCPQSVQPGLGLQI